MAGFANKTWPSFAVACDARLASDVEAGHLGVGYVDGERWWYNGPVDGQWFDGDCNRWRRPNDTLLTPDGKWFGIACEALPGPTPPPEPTPTPSPPTGDGCLERLVSIGLGFKRLPNACATLELCPGWGTDIHAPRGADCTYAMDASPRGYPLREDGQLMHLGDDPACFELVKPRWEQDHPGCEGRDDCIDVGVWSPSEPGSATWVREADPDAHGYFARFELAWPISSRIRACLGDVCSPWRTLYQE